MAIDPNLRISAPLVPRASPVDLYVRPPQPSRRTDLYGLAGALGGLSQELDSLIASRKGETDAALKAKAEADFWTQNAAGGAEGVRQGSIPANHNPVYRRAYNETQGKLAGIQLAERFTAEFNAWDGRTSGDLAAYDAFFTDFVQRNLTGADPYVVSSAAEVLQRAYAANAQVFVKDSSDALKHNYVTAQTAIIAKTIDGAAVQGTQRLNEDGTPAGPDLDGLWNNIMGLRNEAVANGNTTEEMDRQVIDTIINQALAHDDKRILSLLDKEIPGEGHSYADTPYGGQRKNAIAETFDVEARRIASERDQAQREHDRKVKDLLQSQAQQAIAADNQATFPNEFFDAAAAVGWSTARTDVTTWRGNLRGEAEREDQNAILDVYRHLMRGEGQAAINSALSNGVIKNGATLTALYAFKDSYAKAGAKAQQVINSRTVENYLSSIREMTTPPNYAQSLLPGGWTPAGLRAMTDFQKGIVEWVAKNPEADLTEQYDYLNKLYTGIIGNIKNPGGTVSPEGIAPTYESPTPATGGPPTSPTGAPGAATGAAQQPEGTAPPEASTRPLMQKPPVRSRGEDPAYYELWKENLDENTRALLEQRAAEAGVPIDEYMGQVYERLPESYPWPDRSAGQPSKSIDDLVKEYEQGVPEGKTPAAEELRQRAIEQYRRSLEDSGLWDQSSNDKPPSEIPQITRVSALIDNFANGEVRYRPRPASEDPVQWLSEVTGIDFGVGSGEATASGPYGRFLDHIAGGEAKSYNQRFGEAAGSEKYDLTSMTLDQVASLPANTSGGYTSTASGRYQFLSKTLRSLKSSLGLSGQEVMTPEFQDFLAVAIMKRHGLDEYLAGTITREAFANGLAQEWASLPRVTGAKRGRSFYGQPVAYTVDQMLSAVDALRGEGAITAGAAPKAYANVPNEDIANFLRWNSDPVANDQRMLQSVDPKLQEVISQAREIAGQYGVNFVVGSGRRTKQEQALAKSWGWSPVDNSEHLRGGAADLWVMDGNGAVTFTDNEAYAVLAAAMEEASRRLGYSIRWGGRFRHKDIPHFELIANT